LLCGLSKRTFIYKVESGSSATSGGLQHPQQVQNDQYDGDDDQCVNPITGAREIWTDIPPKEAEQPKHNQDDDDGPKHDVTPSYLGNENHRVC